LVGHGIKIHPFLVLLSVFGGIAFFGIIGFLIGPIILSLLFALMEIHSDVVSMHNK
jgi:predicted PurR-regulated permease PerM